MVHAIPAPVDKQPQVAPDAPVIRINWPRVAFVGLWPAIVAMLLIDGFQAAREHNAQPVAGGPVAADRASSAPQVEPSPPQLVADAMAEAAGDRLPLGISVRGPRDVTSAAAIEITGVPDGWALSAGRPFGENTWRIPAGRLSDVVMVPPRGFAGAIDLAVELRLADDTLVERRSVRRARIGQAQPPELAQPIEPVRSTAIELPPSSASAENIEQVASNIGEPGSEQIVLLLKVAEGLLAAGDLSTARTLLRRAVKAGSARAALLLGETYDPGLLGRFKTGSWYADSATARTWYEVAREFGSSDAHWRLHRLAHDEPADKLPSPP